MKKNIVITFLIVVFIAGCVKTSTVTQPKLFPPMSKSEGATLSWTNMPEGLNIKGVNIYVGKGDTSWIHEDGNSDILKQHLVNDSPITDTTYELTNLENGEEYFVQLRVVVGSSPTDEGSEIKRFYPRPEGQVVLYAIGEGDSTGFYWNENGEITIIKAEDNQEIVDVCIIKDTTEGVYYLVSPSEQFETGKTTGYLELGEETDGWEWYKIIDAPTENYINKIALTPNIIVGIHTSDDHYAKLRFESSTGNQINATAISLTWAFQTRKGYYHY